MNDHQGSAKRFNTKTTRKDPAFVAKSAVSTSRVADNLEEYNGYSSFIDDKGQGHTRARRAVQGRAGAQLKTNRKKTFASDSKALGHCVRKCPSKDGDTATQRTNMCKPNEGNVDKTGVRTRSAGSCARTSTQHRPAVGQV
jgi:hypothetical protein